MTLHLFTTLWVALLTFNILEALGSTPCSNFPPTIIPPNITETKVNAIAGGFLLFSNTITFNFSTSPNNTVTSIDDGLFWEVFNQKTLTPLTATLSIPGAINPSTRWLEDPPNRPILSIPSEVLVENRVYTFRVTASIFNCKNLTGPKLVSAASISFKVNDRPANGTVAVSPLSGTSFNTPFSLSTTGWVDTDLPLVFAFEFVTLADDEVAPKPDESFPLSDFSSGSTLSVVLASVKVKRNFVLAVARDTLGGLGTAMSQEIQLFPLYDPGKVPADQLPQPQSITLDASTATRSIRFQALTVAALQTKTLSPAVIPPADVSALIAWRQEIAREAVNLAVITNTQQLSRNVVYIVLQVLQTALDLESNLGRDLLEPASKVLNLLMLRAFAAGRELVSQFGQSGIASYIHPGFFRGSLDTIAFIAKGMNKDNPPPFATQSPTIIGVRRRLQSLPPTSPAPTTTSPTLSPTPKPTIHFELNLKVSLHVLLFIATQGLAPATPARQLQSKAIQVSIARESRRFVGTKSLFGLDAQGSRTRVAFPQGFELLSDGNLRGISTNAFSPTAPTLPQGVITPDIAAAIATIDVVVLDSKVNFREIQDTYNDPPEYNESSGIIDIDGILVPGFTVKHMSTVLFISSTLPQIIIDPFNLSRKINVTLPLPADYVFPAEGSNHTIACGAWNETFNGWSADGCEVIEVRSDSVVCSCNHASDFAAWTAFLKNVGGGDIGVIVTISIVVVGILFPGLVLMYTGLMLWARNQDERDAHGVHIGALLLLTKNTIRLKQMQRRFFKALRKNAGKKQQKTKTEETEELLRKREEEANKAFYDRLKKQKPCYVRVVPSFIRNWIHALLYDHTVFGLYFRFDPYYTRTQRATVITAIVCGNLFVCALLFDLKTAHDISTTFTVIVVAVSSMIVAIPVKFMVRFLFRETQAKTGSLMDRVTHIYRISQLNYDVVPGVLTSSAAEKADLEMLLAFRRYYVAKAELKHAQLVFEEAADLANEALGRRRCCYCCRRQKRLSRESVQRKSIANRVGLLSDAAILGQVEDKENPVPIFDLTGLKKVVNQAKINVRSSEYALRVTCENATLEWSKVPRIPSLRAETLRKQRSSLMRIAALLFDESEDMRPKPRRKICTHAFIYIAWTCVFIYLAACLAYSARWLLAYTSIKPDSPLAQSKEDADTVIVTWLVASFMGCGVGLFISEPALQFIPFSLMPMLLKRCGRGVASKDEIIQRHHELILQRQNAEIKLGGAAPPATITAFSSSSPSSASFNAQALLASKGKGKRGQSVEDYYVQKKAWLHDRFWKQQREKKAGESHVETLSAGLFDFASEIVDALA